MPLIIWTRIIRVFRLRNGINFSETPHTSQIVLKFFETSFIEYFVLRKWENQTKIWTTVPLNLKFDKYTMLYYCFIFRLIFWCDLDLSQDYDILRSMSCQVNMQSEKTINVSFVIYIYLLSVCILSQYNRNLLILFKNEYWILQKRFLFQDTFSICHLKRTRRNHIMVSIQHTHIYIYLYSHPQTDFFVVSQRFKLGSKPA